MANNQTSAKKQGRGFKEFVRKLIVSLKRGPSIIPMLALCVSFVYYSLNLACISNTTIRIYASNMGQCEFVGMLAGILVLVIFLKCFPKRQKPNYIFVGLTMIVIALLVFVDAVYVTRIQQTLSNPDNGFIVDGADSFILTARTVMIVHMIMLIISAALIVLLPVYGKLLKKIKTSIDVEGNDDMAAIELTDDGE